MASSVIASHARRMKTLKARKDLKRQSRTQTLFRTHVLELKLPPPKIDPKPQAITCTNSDSTGKSCTASDDATATEVLFSRSDELSL